MKFRIYFFVFLVFSLAESKADIEVLTPLVAGTTVVSAPDYATNVLGNPWDMDSRADLAEYIQHADYGTGISHYSNFRFTSNRFAYKILSNNSNLAFFHLLSPGQQGTNPLGKNGQVYPIETASYRYLTIRMHSSQAANMRLLWNLSPDYGTRYVRSDPMGIKQGWHTYKIDLANIAASSHGGHPVNPAWLVHQNVTGFRIDTYKKSASAPNVDIAIDWIRLTGAAPASANFDYNFIPAGDNTLFSIFIDNDNTPFNGHLDKVVLAGNAGASVNYFPTYLAPGSYRVLGVASDDFATLNGLPWNMTSQQQIEQTVGMINTATAGSQFSATVNASQAYLDLEQLDSTIDTTKFRYLTIALNTGGASGNTQIRWYDVNGNLAGSTQQFYAGGAGLVQIDLQGLAGWNGQISKLRIYPLINQNSFNFSIDYVTLRANGYSAAELALPVVDGSPGNLIVNSPPQIKILQPDVRGGADFASTVLGKPWNMSSLEDIKYVQNLSEAWIYPNNYMNGRQGDYFCAVNRANNEDPYQLSFQTTQRAEAATKIDASRFRNATIDFFIAREQDVVDGSVLRMIAWNMTRDSSWINGDDVMIPHIGPGWVRITQDMTKLKLEEILHPPGTAPNPAWAGLMEAFRIDVHEFSDPTWFCIDNIELRADAEANSRFALTYLAEDTNTDPAQVNISWYYGTSESTTNGTLITTRSLAENSRVFVWNTKNIPNGTYWIHARINDGFNEIRRMGHRLVINHSLAEDQVLPELELDTPVAGSSWRQTLRLKGYAIDDRQLALVEVLANNQLIHAFVPQSFNKTARDLFPEYVDASRAGFDERVTISNLGLGSHTIIVRAIDTSGNVTQKSININRIAGNDPAFPNDPQVNEQRVAVPLDGKSTAAKLDGKYLPKKKTLRIIAENMHSCSQIQIYAHHNLDQLLSNYTQTSLLKTWDNLPQNHSLQLKKIKGFRGGPGVGKGQLQLGAVCDGKLISTRRFSFARGAPAVKKYSRFINILTKRLARAP